MCIDMCIDMRTDMCADVRIDLPHIHISRSPHHVHNRADTHACARVHAHLHAHVDAHVDAHVLRGAPRALHPHCTVFLAFALPMRPHVRYLRWINGNATGTVHFFIAAD